MKAILAFGDSLTWGARPEGDGQHPYADLWPTVLEAGLGGAARVVAEGLGGRTTAYDDWTGPADRNGARILPTLLHTHAPLDLVVILLGTNDLKAHIAGSAMAARQGMARLVEIVRHHPYPRGAAAPDVLIVAPPVFVAATGGRGTRAEGETAESRRLAPLYEGLSREAGCAFLDAGGAAASSPIDGIHLDAASTRALGRALVGPVRGLLKR